MILGDVIERNARCFGSSLAVIFEGRSLTHAEFATRVRKLINALTGLGCLRQDRIAVLSRNSVEYLEIYGAAALGGFIGVGINYRLATNEQLGILADAEPSVLIFESEYAERAEELRRKLPSTLHFICIGAGPSWAQDYGTVVAGGTDGVPTIRALPDDTLFLIYTSGTTGKPKGVMLGNESQLEQARTQALAQEANPTDRMLIVMPFYHIGGPTELLTYMVVGATIVLHRTFDAREILRSIQSERVTAAHLAPTMIQMMLEVKDDAAYDVSSLKKVCYASAPMSVELSKRAQATFGAIFLQIYGMTEFGLGSTMLKHQHIVDGSAKDVGRLASAGQPYLGTEMRIRRDDGSDCAVGEVGEIWMRGKSLMQGYWRKPEATRDVIHDDGYFRSGDMGFLDEDNFLFIVDRKKDMVVSGGENIYSREVEEALLSHPGVSEVAIIGAPDPRWGESVVAVIVRKPGSVVSEDELTTHVRALIAGYKRPKIFQFVDALPRISSTNKVDKRALRAPYWATQERQVS